MESITEFKSACYKQGFQTMRPLIPGCWPTEIFTQRSFFHIYSIILTTFRPRLKYNAIDIEFLLFMILENVSPSYLPAKKVCYSAIYDRIKQQFTPSPKPSYAYNFKHPMRQGFVLDYGNCMALVPVKNKIYANFNLFFHHALEKCDSRN